MFIGDGSAIISCKRALPGPNLEVDVSFINQAINRIPEISIATPPKALELEATFNRAIGDALEKIAIIEYELTRALRNSNSIKSMVMLDKVSSILESKGISNSADTRKAALDSDREYQDSLEKVDALKALSVFMDGKLEALKMAYFGTKDVLKSYSSEYGKMGKMSINEPTFAPRERAFGVDESKYKFGMED